MKLVGTTNFTNVTNAHTEDLWRHLLNWPQLPVLQFVVWTYLPDAIAI